MKRTKEELIADIENYTNWADEAKKELKELNKSIKNQKQP